MGVADSGSARKTGQSCKESMATEAESTTVTDGGTRGRSKDGQVLNFVCTTVATGDPTAAGGHSVTELLTLGAHAHRGFWFVCVCVDAYSSTTGYETAH